MYEEKLPPDHDDGELARLLAATGPREQPSPEATAEIRAAVEAEWRQSVAGRRERRRYASWAVAAGVAAAAVAVWMARPLYRPASGPVASLARVVGHVEIDTGDGHWTPMSAGTTVRAGAVIRTNSTGRAALSMEDGVELRLDSGTRLAFNDASGASMTQGAVYVDSGPEAGPQAADFQIETPAGSVRHLGTQYEARLADGGLRVAIREGRVEVRAAGEAVLGSAGEVVTVGKGGATRSRLSPTASDWKWVNDVTPPFSIEGRSVDDFLAWASRETGRKVVYSSPLVERQARSVMLRGTVEGLAPDQAVAAVLSTTSLRPVLGDDQITVEAAAR